MAKVPADLKKNKETIIANMDARELLSSIIAVLMAIGILYFSYVAIGINDLSIPAILSGILASPVVLFGFIKIKGMHIEEYLKIIINNKLLACEVRENVSKYEEDKVVNSKYELIRAYRIDNENKFIDMYNYLKDDNILLLTKCITIGCDRYVMFRVNAKKLINEKEKYYRELRKDKKYRKENKQKTYEDVKREIDIFSGKFGKVEIIEDDELVDIKNKLSSINNEFILLHLYDIDNIDKVLSIINEKIIFLNNDMGVSIYMYVNDNDKNLLKDNLVEYFTIDKKNAFYNSVISLNVKNIQNIYRKTKDLKGII